MVKRLSRKDAALLIGFCVLATFLSLEDYPIEYDDASPPEFRRALRARGQGRGARGNRNANGASRKLGSEGQMYPWAENKLQPLTVKPDPKHEVALFWHVPKSGGTTMKGIAECLDLTIANRAGALARFGHDNDNKIIAFRPWKQRGPSYVNADTTSFPGIRKAERLGLVPSGLADIIFTSYPDFAIAHLYDEKHKGRAMGIFRHPVDRLVSKFYYLQIADWERTYHPNWKNITVQKWARNVNRDNNHMVKKLAGKKMNDDVSEVDLNLAINTVRERFYVGLMDKMEESIHRFNVVMGIDETAERPKKCMDEYFGHGVEKKNSNSHPKVEEGSDAWNVLARKNDLDVRLYEYIIQLFDEQKEIIESYNGQNLTPQEIEIVQDDQSNSGIMES